MMYLMCVEVGRPLTVGRWAPAAAAPVAFMGNEPPYEYLSTVCALLAGFITNLPTDKSYIYSAVGK